MATSCLPLSASLAASQLLCRAEIHKVSPQHCRSSLIAGGVKPSWLQLPSCGIIPGNHVTAKSLIPGLMSTPSQLRPRHSRVRCQATGPDSAETSVASSEPAKLQQASSGGWLDSASNGMFALIWVALAGYATFVAPNQTPVRDEYFLKQLVGLYDNNGIPLNTILSSIFMLMGVYPAIYTALILPTGRSRNGSPPALPFLIASFAIGAFALLPFFALHNPPCPPVTSEDVNKLPLKATESKIFAGSLVLGALFYVGMAALAGGDQWLGYAQLFNESKFVCGIEKACLR
eukprot:jgi/Mesvir1/3532/Mv12003-RA.2